VRGDGRTSDFYFSELKKIQCALPADVGKKKGGKVGRGEKRGKGVGAKPG